LGAALADDLANNRAAAGERPTADHTLLRGSDAYRCGRQITFGALKVPRVVPYTTDTLMAFDAGQHHHTRLQGLLASKFGAELEVQCSYKDQGIDLSGHADAVYTLDNDKRCVEIKSMKSYPFLKSAGGTDRYGRDVDPEGPKIDHMVQAGLYGLSPQIQADTLHMAYLEKETGRVAEWLIPIKGQAVGPRGEDVYTLVMAELGRLTRIAEDIRKGLLSWRRIPGYGVVKDTPAAESKDEPWNCRYCAWQPLCAKLPPSPVAVALATNGAGPADEEAF
jgi:hypothetical protein